MFAGNSFVSNIDANEFSIGINKAINEFYDECAKNLKYGRHKIHYQPVLSNDGIVWSALIEYEVENQSRA